MNNETSSNKSSFSQYLALFWPLRQSRTAVEPNLSLSQNIPIALYRAMSMTIVDRVTVFQFLVYSLNNTLLYFIYWPKWSTTPLWHPKDLWETQEICRRSGRSRRYGISGISGRCKRSESTMSMKSLFSFHKSGSKRPACPRREQLAINGTRNYQNRQCAQYSGDTQKAIAVIERDPHQTKANFVSTRLDYFRYT